MSRLAAPIVLTVDETERLLLATTPDARRDALAAIDARVARDASACGCAEHVPHLDHDPRAAERRETLLARERLESAWRTSTTDDTGPKE